VQHFTRQIARKSKNLEHHPTLERAGIRYQTATVVIAAGKPVTLFLLESAILCAGTLE